MVFTSVDIIDGKFETRIRFPCFCQFILSILSPDLINLLQWKSKYGNPFILFAHTVIYNTTVKLSLPLAFLKFILEIATFILNCKDVMFLFWISNFLIHLKFFNFPINLEVAIQKAYGELETTTRNCLKRRQNLWKIPVKVLFLLFQMYFQGFHLYSLRFLHRF